jgi:sulfur carrier protein
MLVTVNGERRELESGTTLAELLSETGAPGGGRGCAVALDAEVVPRRSWESTVIPEGAAVEVVVAVQGG